MNTLGKAQIASKSGSRWERFKTSKVYKYRQYYLLLLPAFIYVLDVYKRQGILIGADAVCGVDVQCDFHAALMQIREKTFRLWK